MLPTLTGIWTILFDSNTHIEIPLQEVTEQNIYELRKTISECRIKKKRGGGLECFMHCVKHFSNCREQQIRMIHGSFA